MDRSNYYPSKNRSFTKKKKKIRKKKPRKPKKIWLEIEDRKLL